MSGRRNKPECGEVRKRNKERVFCVGLCACVRMTATSTMKKQQSLTGLEMLATGVKKDSVSTQQREREQRRTRSAERGVASMTISSSGGSSRDLSSEDCLSHSSSSKPDDLYHFYQVETATTVTDDTGIDGCLSKSSSPKSTPPAPHLSHLLDDSDSDTDSSRRRTIVFQRRDDEHFDKIFTVF